MSFSKTNSMQFFVIASGGTAQSYTANLMASETLKENITRSYIDDIRTTEANHIVEFKNGKRAYIRLGEGDAALREVREHTAKNPDREKLVKNFMSLSLKVKGR